MMQVDDFNICICKTLTVKKMVAMTTGPPIVKINDSDAGIIIRHAESSLLDGTDDLVTRRRSHSETSVK